MNKNIEYLYGQLTSGNKKIVVSLISNACDRKTGSVRINWLTLGETPDKFKDTVIKVLQNAVRNQK